MEDESLSAVRPSRAEQFFGFDPHVLLDDLYSMIEEYICEALDQLQQALTKHPILSKQEAFVQQTVDELETALFENLDSNFEGFRTIALMNIFSIPDDLSLSDPTTAPEEPAETTTPEQLVELRNQVEHLQQELEIKKQQCLNQKISPFFHSFDKQCNS